MINNINGNLLDQPLKINYILQGCNTQCRQGAGLALAIKNMYPEAYEADKKFYKNMVDFYGGNESIVIEAALGCISVAHANSLIYNNSELTIVNCYQQKLIENRLTGVNLDYNAFYRSLKTARDFIDLDNREHKCVGIPYGIGCGLAGGEWDICEAIINNVFKSADYTVLIVKL